MSIKQATEKAKEIGLTIQEVRIIRDREKKRAEDSLKPVRYKRVWSMANKIGEDKSKPQEFQLSHKQLIEDYLLRHKGRATLNGKPISKPKLALHIQKYFQDLKNASYMFYLNVEIEGKFIKVNLDNELQKKNSKSRESERDEFNILSAGDKYGNYVLIATRDKIDKKK